MNTINYIVGDLLNHPNIVHGCNGLGVMGSGVALAIKNKWPDCFSCYKNHLHSLYTDAAYTEPEDCLGKTSVYKKDDLVIFNAITQAYTGPGKQVSYDAIHDCFSWISEYCLQHNINVISFPLIGAGLGGGKWAVISTIIESVMDPTIKLNCIVLKGQDLTDAYMN